MFSYYRMCSLLTGSAKLRDSVLCPRRPSLGDAGWVKRASAFAISRVWRAMLPDGWIEPGHGSPLVYTSIVTVKCDAVMGYRGAGRVNGATSAAALPA